MIQIFFITNSYTRKRYSTLSFVQHYNFMIKFMMRLFIKFIILMFRVLKQKTNIRSNPKNATSFWVNFLWTPGMLFYTRENFLRLDFPLWERDRILPPFRITKGAEYLDLLLPLSKFSSVTFWKLWNCFQSLIFKVRKF